MELLVVIIIIAILAGFLVPQITEMMRQKEALLAKNLISGLQAGIRAFEAENNRLPVDPASTGGGKDAEVLTDGSTPILDALLGLPAAGGGADWNPKGTRFAEFSNATNNRGGLVITGRPYQLRDPWGNPFHVLFDLDGDHRVKNPDATNSDAKFSRPGGAPVDPFLPTEVAIFSLGRDGQPYTADDVVSWRQ